MTHPAVQKVVIASAAKQSKPLRLLRAIALAMTFACNHIYHVSFLLVIRLAA